MNEQKTKTEPKVTRHGVIVGIQTPPLASTEDLLGPYVMGGCPKCCRWDEYLPVGSEDWVVCYRHRTKFSWAGGGGSWGDPEHVTHRNAAILEQCTEVEPALPALSREQTVVLLRLADAVADGNPQPLEPEAAKARKEQLSRDAEFVRKWVARDRTAWVQRIHIDDDENPLVKEANER